MGLMIIFIITAAMLIGLHDFSRPASDAKVDTQPGNAAIEADAAAGSAPVTSKPRAAAHETHAPAGEAYAPAVVPAVEPAAEAPAGQLAAVTITGCLERADETTFRLKDTVGADAPKSRSWKSGFLKKAPASIDVVDTAQRLKLPDHVGQKVSVTGTLVDREMQVRSLQRVATSCDNNPKVKV